MGEAIGVRQRSAFPNPTPYSPSEAFRSASNSASKSASSFASASSGIFEDQDATISKRDFFGPPIRAYSFAKIPAGVIDYYLLVTSDPANAIAPVRMRVINTRNDTLKRGQMLWFNVTKNPVAGIVGSEKLAIKPASR